MEEYGGREEDNEEELERGNLGERRRDATKRKESTLRGRDDELVKKVRR